MTAKQHCWRCDGTGLWMGGADQGTEYKCDPCPAPPNEYTKEGHLIMNAEKPDRTVLKHGQTITGINSDGSYDVLYKTEAEKPANAMCEKHGDKSMVYQRSNGETLVFCHACDLEKTAVDVEQIKQETLRSLMHYSQLTTFEKSIVEITVDALHAQGHLKSTKEGE